MDQQKLEDILIEKWKYLFFSEYNNSYELIDLKINFFHAGEMELTIDVDYLGGVDGRWGGLSIMLKKTNEDLIYFFHKYPVNPQTKKIDKQFRDFVIPDPLISQVNFKFDESHKIQVYLYFDF